MVVLPVLGMPRMPASDIGGLVDSETQPRDIALEFSSAPDVSGRERTVVRVRRQVLAGHEQPLDLRQQLRPVQVHLSNTECTCVHC